MKCLKIENIKHLQLRKIDTGTLGKIEQNSDTETNEMRLLRVIKE